MYIGGYEHMAYGYGNHILITLSLIRSNCEYKEMNKLAAP